MRPSDDILLVALGASSLGSGETAIGDYHVVF